MKTIKQWVAVILLLTMGATTVWGAPVESPQEVPEQPPTITAPSGVVIDATTGIVVYEKDKDDKKYPASITKVMTALLCIEALEKGASLTDTVVFSQEAVGSLPYGSSNIAMEEGETLTVSDGLYALLLASANEVANALAEHMGGTGENFVAMMNARAKALGANNTHFVNPHGLHDPNQQTTAYDMALMTKQALTHPLFETIIATPRYTIQPTSQQPEPRFLVNSHKMIQPASPNYNTEVVGGKTGYTAQAKHTLVTYAKRGDVALIVVVMEDNKEAAYTDTLALLDYGFNQFETVTIFDKTAYANQLGVWDAKTNASVGQVGIAPSDSVVMTLPKAVKAHTTTTSHLPQNSTKSVVQGQKLGNLSINYQNNVLATVGLFATNSVALPQTLPPANFMQMNFFQMKWAQMETTLPFGLTLWQVGQILLGLFFVCLCLLAFLGANRKWRRTAKYGLRPAKKMTYGYKKTGRP